MCALDQDGDWNYGFALYREHAQANGLRHTFTLGRNEYAKKPLLAAHKNILRKRKIHCSFEKTHSGCFTLSFCRGRQKLIKIKNVQSNLLLLLISYALSSGGGWGEVFAWFLHMTSRQPCYWTTIATLNRKCMKLGCLLLWSPGEENYEWLCFRS